MHAFYSPRFSIEGEEEGEKGEEKGEGEEEEEGQKKKRFALDLWSRLKSLCDDIDEDLDVPMRPGQSGCCTA